MDYKNVIAEIDAQISKLQQARDVLTGLAGSQSTDGRQGRKRKNMSAAARARIAAAQKARWAKVRASKRR